MGAEELRVRLDKFEVPATAWKNVRFFERSFKFSDVIKPNEVNVVDYFEVVENFYSIAGDIKAIFDKLKNGIALINIQKKIGSSLGRGAEFGLEKARLYIALDAGKLTIVKAKNWVDRAVNPNGRVIEFKLINGCKFQGV